MIEVNYICLQLAQEIKPAPIGLLCLKCRDRLQCNADRAANYLRWGWPTCCGNTMRLVLAGEEKLLEAAVLEAGRCELAWPSVGRCGRRQGHQGSCDVIPEGGQQP